ncbi:hypothetical protein BH23PAT2_BH23PAT2_06080 [soil metagenome]
MDLRLTTIQKLKSALDEKPKLSIYIPTHPNSSSQTIEEDRIRFKNALARLDTHETQSKDELGKTYASLQKLTEQTDFWQHQELSLAVFADGDGYQTMKLPYEVNEVSLMSGRYIISPLELMRSIRMAFYVFEINLHEPKLYLGTTYGLSEVRDIKLPKSMKNELDLEDTQKQTQFHTGAVGGDAMFHGHGGEKDNKQHDVDRYFQLVHDALETYLDGHDIPLVLSGDDRRVAQFRKMLSYGRVIQPPLPPVQDAKHAEVHSKANDIVSGAVHEHQSHEVERYNELLSTKLAIKGLQIDDAAKAGRIDTLYVSCLRETRDSVREGDFTATKMEVPENILQLESIVSEVISKGGNILAVNTSTFDTEELYAICRF